MFRLVYAGHIYRCTAARHLLLTRSFVYIFHYVIGLGISRFGLLRQAVGMLFQHQLLQQLLGVAHGTGMTLGGEAVAI